MSVTDVIVDDDASAEHRAATVPRSAAQSSVT